MQERTCEQNRAKHSQTPTKHSPFVAFAQWPKGHTSNSRTKLLAESYVKSCKQSPKRSLFGDRAKKQRTSTKNIVDTPNHFLFCKSYAQNIVALLEVACIFSVTTSGSFSTFVPFRDPKSKPKTTELWGIPYKNRTFLAWRQFLVDFSTIPTISSSLALTF